MMIEAYSLVNIMVDLWTWWWTSFYKRQNFL